MNSAEQNKTLTIYNNKKIYKLLKIYSNICTLQKNNTCNVCKCLCTMWGA